MQPTLYDDQAARFDARAGVPAEVAEAVAYAVADIASLAAGDLLLEVGAGTGSLSLAFLRLSVRYAGFDSSPEMVRVFRERAAATGLGVALQVADGNGRWPAADHSAAAVFASRAIHHLHPGHVAAETMRVLRAPAGVLAVGRVRRAKDSAKAVMRREMRRLLAAAGHAGRSAEDASEAVFAALEVHGARRLPAVTAARWTVEHAPADSIAAWEQKPGLAGADVPAGVKRRVLDELRVIARERFGDPEAPLPQEEAFEICAIHVPVG